MKQDQLFILAGILMLCCCSSSAGAIIFPALSSEETAGPSASGGAGASSTDKTIKGVRYVRIERPTGNYPENIINLSEIEVHDKSGVNVAKAKTVTGGPGGAHSAGPFANLVDENLENFAHTTGNGVTFLEIDLGSDTDVKAVKVVNRGATTTASCCWNRIKDAKVILFDKDKTELKTTSVIDKFDKRTSTYDFTATSPVWVYA